MPSIILSAPAPVAKASPARTFVFAPQPQPPTFPLADPYRPVGAPSRVIFPERSGVRNSNNTLGNTQPHLSSCHDLTNMALDSFADPGYARAMVTHAQATIDNLTVENHKLSANMHNLANENDALKRQVEGLKVVASLVPTAALETESRRMQRIIDNLDAQEEELMSRLHSLVEGNSQEHEQSENQDTAAADAGQLEHGAGDDDASSSSSVTEGGIIDRPVKVEDTTATYEQRSEDWVPAVEDTAAAHEQRVEHWVPAVEDSSTAPNVTVPGWKQLSLAELENLAQGRPEVLAHLTESAARDHGPSDSFAGVCGRYYPGGDAVE
jgi:DNA replication initiation complex subunit (GINS family)